MNTAHLAVFAYHDVTDAPESTGFQRPGALPYRLDVAAFREHLDAIARGPCVPELVDDVALRRPGRHLLLTFDDGGVSALSICDLLEERGWRGHFFVVTARIGSPRFLSAAEIREVRRRGHLVGSHSHTHPDIFRELSRDAMATEWRTSCARLGDILGEPCVAASVPGGDSSGLVLRTAAEAGIRFLFTSEPQLVPRRVRGCWALGRYCVKARTRPALVQSLAGFDGWGGAMMWRRVTVLARRSAPPLYRLYVRARTHADGVQGRP